MLKRKLFGSLREENKKLKAELDTLRRGAKEASDAVDAILITAAGTLGEKGEEEGARVLTLPFPDVRECREKYTLHAEKTDSGEMRITVSEKP
ncbi:MAG: hypothetical protein IJS65_00930 [Clostridia bacterium]|nr:hypothetical protein [Clostridia bacterium]